jgi:hypothetical protein
MSPLPDNWPQIEVMEQSQNRYRFAPVLSVSHVAHDQSCDTHLNSALKSHHLLSAPSKEILSSISWISS